MEKIPAFVTDNFFEVQRQRNLLYTSTIRKNVMYLQNSFSDVVQNNQILNEK